MIKEKKTKVNTVFTCSAKAMNRYREDAQREQRGQGVAGVGSKIRTFGWMAGSQSFKKLYFTTYMRIISKLYS